MAKFSWKKPRLPPTRRVRIVAPRAPRGPGLQQAARPVVRPRVGYRAGARALVPRGGGRRRAPKVNVTHAVLGALVVLSLLLSSSALNASRAPTVQISGGHSSGGGGGGGGAAGADGFSALVAIMAESPGANCAPGGQLVDAGLDDGSGGGTERDGILQAGEVEYSAYVCDGADGAAGTNGADGYNSLVKSTTESPGVNCAAGGKKIESGLDNGDGGGVSRNGVLEAGEVDATTYVCNGAAGSNGADGYNSLVKTTAESPGANCAAGGRKVESGLDNGDGGGTARNGVLEAGEVDATTYVCNGAAGTNGVDGFNSLVASAAEAIGANCADAGRKITSGLDNGDGGGTARNGVLEAGEVDVTSYVCNGRPAALRYTYNTGTSGDPGSGKFGFDTATLSAIVTLRISETDGDGNAIAALIATWDDSTSSVRSTITVTGNGAPTRVLVFTITSAITDVGAYDSFTVSYVTSVGSHANNDVDTISQSRTGDKGDTGTAGSNGAAGRDAGLKYTYSTGTSGDPGSGKFGFDTTTLASIVTFRISETDGDSNGIAALIATWDDSTTTGARSTITFVGDAAPTRLLVFTITSAITDNGAYDSFTIAYVTSSGSWSNNDVDKAFQSRTGDKGAAGADGANGAGFSVTKALGSAATSTSTTGAEATGLNSGSLASGTYVANYYLVCRTAATTTGIDFGVNFDNTQGIIVSTMMFPGTGQTATIGTADGTVQGDDGELMVEFGSAITETTTAPNLNVITGVATASEDFLVWISVVVTPTATGELELWFATDVASSQVDIRAGSSVTIIKTG